MTTTTGGDHVFSVDENGTLVARDRTESPATDPAEIVRTIGELVRKVWELERERGRRDT